jgi:hypothetical protein
MFQTARNHVNGTNAQWIKFGVELASNLSLDLLNALPNLNDAMDRGVRLEGGRELLYCLISNVNAVGGESTEVTNS